MGLGWLVSGAYHPAYRKKFNIKAAQISGAPTNIPLALVIASDTDLAADARSDGHDIAITKADGTTELDYERVSWDEGTGALEIWFKAPDPESGDDYYLYYGDADQAADRQNATGAWSNSFAAVWHMDDATTSTILDSTSDDNDGTKGAANEPIEVGGQIGQAQSFDRTNDEVITIANESNFDFDVDDPFTLSAWAKCSITGAHHVLISKHDGDAGYFFSLYNGVANELRVLGQLQEPDGYLYKYGDTDIGDGDWHRLVFTYDGGNTLGGMLLYVNGALEGAGGSGSDGTLASLLHNEAVRLGARGGGIPLYLGGDSDENRISSVERSANWIATSYNNQDSPAPGGTFWSALGSEEKESRHPAVVFQCPAIV